MKTKATFLLLAYNQAPFLRDAIAGAFSQTHTPLEILISDDCSTDGSQELIREMAQSYSGPHQIRTNFNESNLGIIRHLTLAFHMASSPVVVVAAGDDVSSADRVRRVLDIFDQSGGRVHAAFSDAIAIDEFGQEQGYQDNFVPESGLTARGLASGGGYINGAAAAYARRLIVEFGEIDPRSWAEDSILPFRAALLGRVVHIPEPLLRRRLHKASMSGGAAIDDAKLLSTMRPAIYAYSMRLADLDHPTARAARQASDLAELKEAVERSIERQKCLIALVERRPGAIGGLWRAVRLDWIGPVAALRSFLALRGGWPWRAYVTFSGWTRRFLMRSRKRQR